MQYVPTKKTVTTGKRATDARTLTSDEYVRIIFEKITKKGIRRERNKEA